MKHLPPILFRRQIIVPAAVTACLSLLVAVASLYLFLEAGRGFLPSPPFGKVISQLPGSSIAPPPPPVRLPAPVIPVPVTTLGTVTAPAASLRPPAEFASTAVETGETEGSGDEQRNPAPSGDDDYSDDGSSDHGSRDDDDRKHRRGKHHGDRGNHWGKNKGKDRGEDRDRSRD